MALTQIEQAMLADGILTADAAGRLKMANGFVNDAKVADVAGSKLTGSRNIPKGTLPAGAVLQVVSATSQAPNSTTSTTRVNSGFSATITPTSATSKILVLFHTYGSYVPASTQLLAFLYKNGSNVIPNDKSWFENETGSTGISPTLSAVYLDSPASASALTYGIYYRTSNGNSVYLMNNGPEYGIMSIILVEIAA